MKTRVYGIPYRVSLVVYGIYSRFIGFTRDLWDLLEIYWIYL